MRYTSKPYAAACDQNKAPILAVLQEIFSQPGTVLEIGSGTGQHAVHFATHLPHLTWQPTDQVEHLPGIALWLEEADLDNIRSVLELNVIQESWPVQQADGVFSANTAHIMSWPGVECLFSGIGRVLVSEGYFCLYGPFNYGGRYTSDSNAQFDQMLKARDPQSGIRDVDDLNQLAKEVGLISVQDYAMPANNRTLVWRRQ